MAFCSAKLDEVSRNKIVEEAIRREERAANGRMATDFQVPDPRKMQILPDKPNYTIPASQPTEQQLQEAHDKLLHLTCVKHIEQTPSQVFQLPITANMEYGFCAAPLVKADPMFQHNKGHCDVTKYAAQYASMKGSSPFQNTNSTSAAKTKK